MQSPYVVGFLSIIPGLGFFVLGQYRKGLITISIIVGLILVALFVPSRLIAQLSFEFAILTWVGQIIYSAQSAKVFIKLESGEIAKILVYKKGS